MFGVDELGEPDYGQLPGLIAAEAGRRGMCSCRGEVDDLLVAIFQQQR